MMAPCGGGRGGGPGGGGRGRAHGPAVPAPCPGRGGGGGRGRDGCRGTRPGGRHGGGGGRGCPARLASAVCARPGPSLCGFVYVRAGVRVHVRSSACAPGCLRFLSQRCMPLSVCKGICVCVCVRTFLCACKRWRARERERERCCTVPATKADAGAARACHGRSHKVETKAAAHLTRLCVEDEVCVSVRVHACIVCACVRAYMRVHVSMCTCMWVLVLPGLAVCMCVYICTYVPAWLPAEVASCAFVSLSLSHAWPAIHHT